MCDTLVVMGNQTESGNIIFAKTSDRDVNEGQGLLHVPRMKHPKGAEVKCTYRSVPQVEETFSVLLSKPFWIWGAEMGTNEFGVTIGNEAQFSKYPQESNPSLIGMDFIRIALERTKTAKEALELMIEYLEKYGQAGNCGYEGEFHYFNGYIIADTKEAYLLETVGRMWIVEKVKNYRTISNALSIEEEYDLIHPELISFSKKKGWTKKNKTFNFARDYSDTVFTKFGKGRERQCRTTELIREFNRKLSVKDAAVILRDHGKDAHENWSPGPGLSEMSICMHAGFGPIRKSQSTGSMISELSPKLPTHFLTGTSAPCLSLYKPVWMDSGLPNIGAQPEAEANLNSLWWNHEQLHRKVLQDFPKRSRIVKNAVEVVEANYLKPASHYENINTVDRRSISNSAFQDGSELIHTLIDQIDHDKNETKKAPFYYRWTWKSKNSKAQLRV